MQIVPTPNRQCFAFSNSTAWLWATGWWEFAPGAFQFGAVEAGEEGWSSAVMVG